MSFSNSSEAKALSCLSDEPITISYRDNQGVLPYSRMPWYAIRELAKIYEEGKKYDAKEHSAEGAWRKGNNFSELIDHMINHLNLWLIGDRSEEHMPKIAWAALTITELMKTHPECNDLPTKVGG